MNARFYLPGVGRFISADTIVPDPANPQALNRYSYVLNRPLALIDPTGHGEIDCPTNDCNSNSSSPSEPPQADDLPEQLEDCYINLKKCGLPDRPPGIEDETWNTYVAVWFELLGTEYLLPDGRIVDQYLIALIIRIELQGVSGIPYLAALEAISNQYDGWGCGGGCSSLAQQLNWLDAMHAWRERDGSTVSLNDCPWCLADAARAMNNYNDSYSAESWWWANPTRESAMHKYIEQYGLSGTATPEWRADTLGGAFIVASQPCTGCRYFVVMTQAQDAACANISGDVTCNGFPKSIIADISN